MAKPFIAVIDSEIFNPGVAGEEMPLNRLGPGSRESYVNKGLLWYFSKTGLVPLFILFPLYILSHGSQSGPGTPGSSQSVSVSLQREIPRLDEVSVTIAGHTGYALTPCLAHFNLGRGGI